MADDFKIYTGYSRETDYDRRMGLVSAGEYRGPFVSQLKKNREELLEAQKQKKEELLTGDPKEDAKTKKYIENTQYNPDDFDIKAPEGYGVTDYLKDAYTTFGEKVNESQANDYYGRIIRSQEGVDLADRALAEIPEWDKLNAIDNYNKFKKLYDETPATHPNSKRNALSNLQKATAELNKYYQNIEDPSVQQQMKQDRQDLFYKLNNENSATNTMKRMARGSNMGPITSMWRSIGIFFHNDDSEDWIGDRVDEAYAKLDGFETASTADRAKMLNAFKKENEKHQQYFLKKAEFNEKEAEEFTNRHQVSDYFRNRAVRGNMRTQNGESMWNFDNLLYSQIEQQGFSAAAWDKQLAAMGLQILGGVLTAGGSVGIQMLGGAALVAGGATQIEAGKTENNAEVYENLKERIKNNLKKNNLEDAVLKDAKSKFKGATDDEIYDKIVQGRYLPNKSKAVKEIAGEISDSLVSAREGANALYERDMYATTSDAMFDSALAGSGKMLKGLGSFINSRLGKKASIQFVKDKGKWIAEYAGSGIGAAYETGSTFGVAAGIGTAATKVGLNVAGRAVAEKPLVALARKKAGDAIKFARNVPLKLLGSDDVAKSFIRNKRFGKYVKTPLTIAGKVTSAGYSEAIEEGKQYLNAQDWINNEDPERTVGLFDGLLKDSARGLSLATAAAGVPFGLQLGLATDGELYSNMSGGWLGGAMHHALVAGGRTMLSSAVGPDKISIADAISQNALLGQESALSRYDKGSKLASVVLSDPRESLRQLDEFKQFNEQRKEAGLSYIEEDELKGEEDFIKTISSIAHNPATREHAEMAGIEYKSPEYYKYISALSLYKDIEKNHSDSAKATIQDETTLVEQEVDRLFGEEEQAMGIFGDTNEDHPLVQLFRPAVQEEEKKATQAEIKRPGRPKKGESTEEYRKRYAAYKEALKDVNTDQAIAASIIAEDEKEESPAVEQVSAEDIYRQAATDIIEIVALQDYLDNIETLDKYSEVAKHHDVDYIKKEIRSKIAKLKSRHDKATMDKALSNPRGYIGNDSLFDKLSEVYQTRMGHEVEAKAAWLLHRRLWGFQNISDVKDGKIIFDGWNVKDAKDVLAKLDKSIEDKYDLVDRVNQEYEARAINKVYQAKQEDTTGEQQAQQQTVPQVQPTPRRTQQPKEQEEAVVAPYTAPAGVTQAPATVTQQPTVQAGTQAPATTGDPNVDQQLSLIQGLLHRQSIEDAQETVAQRDLNQQIVDAGAMLMGNAIENGKYKFKDAVEFVLDYMLKFQLSESDIYQLSPYFKQWYIVQQLNPNVSPDVFDSVQDIRMMDTNQIIDIYIYDNKPEEEKAEIIKKYKQQIKKSINAVGVYDSIEDLVDNVKDDIKEGDTVATLNEDDKSVHVYHVAKVNKTKDGIKLDLRNDEGIMVVKDSIRLDEQQIENLKQAAETRSLNQDVVMNLIEKKAAENEKGLLGVTAHDYFYDENGRTYMYMRVHAINGDQFERLPEWNEVKQKAKNEIAALLRAGRYDEVANYTVLIHNEFDQLQINTVNQYDNYTLYIEQAKKYANEIDYIADALADIISVPKASSAVEAGNAADEITRIFFDSNEDNVKALDYDTLTIKVKNSNINVSTLMTRAVFDSFIDSLIRMKQEYDNLGYKISSTRNRWHAVVLTENGTWVRVAGETDLIAVDEQGKIHIIDTKTSRYSFKATESIAADGIKINTDRFRNTPDLFGIRHAIYSYDKQYARQLSRYMLIISNSINNIEFADQPLEILPVRLQYDFGELDYNINHPEDVNAPKSIQRMDVGVEGEPTRIILEVQEDIAGSGYATYNVVEDEKEKLYSYFYNISEVIYQFRSLAIDRYNEIKYTNQKYAEQLLSLNKYTKWALDTLEEVREELDNARDLNVISELYNKIATIEYQINAARESLDEYYYRYFTSQESNNQVDHIEGAKTKDEKINNIRNAHREAYDIYQRFTNERTNELYNQLYESLSKLEALLLSYKDEYENYNDNIHIERASLFINQLKDGTQSEAQQSKLEEAKPQPVQIIKQGFRDSNTADLNQQNRACALDDPNNKLSDVLANTDFSENSVTEVVGGVYQRRDGILAVPVRITYNGHTYALPDGRPLEIQISDKQVGISLMQQIQNAFGRRKVGDRVLLTDMNRTGGLPNIEGNPLQSIENSALWDGSYSLYDVSVDMTSEVVSNTHTIKFGLSRFVGLDLCITQQHNIANQQHSIYTFPKNGVRAGKAKAGVMYAVIYPNYKNASGVIDPLVVPLVNRTFTAEDADFLIGLFSKGLNESFVTTDDKGNEVTLPLTNQDVINMFLPEGRYDGNRNKATYYQVLDNGKSVMISFPPNSKNTLGAIKFDITNRDHLDAFKELLTGKDKNGNEGRYNTDGVLINIDATLIDSKFGEATSYAHPLKTLVDFFNRNLNVQYVNFGNTGITIDRNDIKNPNDPNDRRGLSGLAWMMRNQMLLTKFQGLYNPRFSFLNCKVESDAEDQNTTMTDNSDVSTTTDVTTIDGEEYTPEEIEEYVDEDTYLEDYQELVSTKRTYTKKNKDGQKVEFKHVSSQRLYDTALKSLLFYIFKAQGIKVSGANLRNSLDLSSGIFDQQYKFEEVEFEEVEKDGKKIRRVVYEEKEINGKKVRKPKTHEVPKKLRDVILASTKNVTYRRGKPVTSVNKFGQLVMQELMDNWDTIVKEDAINYLKDFMNVDYYEEESSSDTSNNQGDEERLAGDTDEHGKQKGLLEDQITDAKQTSHVARASKGIKFFASRIKKYVIDAYGNQIEYRNELGCLEYMDPSEVIAVILADCHTVKTPTQMVNLFKELGETNKMYEQITKMVYGKYSHMYDNEDYDADSEQFITQLFNLVSCAEQHYKRFYAAQDNKSGRYTITINDCGQEYEARRYKMDWGKVFVSGGTNFLKITSEGRVGRNREYEQTFTEEEKEKGVTSADKLIQVYVEFEQIIKEFDPNHVAALSVENSNETPNLVLDGKTINVTNDQNLVILKSMILRRLNSIGIQLTQEEFDYILKKIGERSGHSTLFDQLNDFLHLKAEESIMNLWNGNFVLFRRDEEGKWRWKVNSENLITGKNGKQIKAENVYLNNSFCSMLADLKYEYNHKYSDRCVLVGSGDKYYNVSLNNTITDVTDDISENGSIAKMLSKYCYNLITSTGVDTNGNTVTSSAGSLLLKWISNLPVGQRLPMKFCTHTQFQTNRYGDTGLGYFDISEREDYVSKATILEDGNIIFPTMSDKTTWGWIEMEDKKLPGILYDRPDKNTVKVKSTDLRGAYLQLLEYAECELASIQQTIKQVKDFEQSEDKSGMVDNFHSGTSVIDRKGKTHKIANGTIFSTLTGVWIEKNGKEEYVSFNRVLDEKGNYISPEKNIETATKYFFGLKTDNEKIEVLRRTVSKQIDAELKHLESLGLVEPKYNGYENVGLNQAAIDAIRRKLFNIPDNKQLSYGNAESIQATRLYVEDIVLKSIMSISEVERVYSGNPAFFKYDIVYKNRKNKDDKSWSKGDGILVNRSVDEFKRLGGLISTGINNNTEILGLPEDGMYNCAQVNNDEVGSEQIELIKERMAEGEFRQAYLRIISGDNFLNATACERAYTEPIEDIKKFLEENYSDVYQILENKIKDESSSYEKGIDVADGGAYISPKMTEWLLRMCGEFDSRVKKAFDILENPDKHNIYEQQEAYKTVTTKVIGAQKYTAYGMRLSEDGTTTIPYYNKMALFPVFKCIATGKFAKVYDQMQKQDVHMLMINSAVKVGGQGSIDYSTDDSFSFNVYKQDFRYLRKQFNTNPHHKEEMSMGTQMVKVALASLIAGKEYITEDGRSVTGFDILYEIMRDINTLSHKGLQLIHDDLVEDGKISPKKLSKLLKDELTARDADIAMIEALDYNEETGDLNMPLSAISKIGWIQSIIVSYINKRVVDVNTPGNAFYQRSIWNMEGESAQFMSDENLPPNLNGGKDLQMVIESKEGQPKDPAEGAMECILTMDYFEDVLKEAGLEDASFDEQKKALMEAGFIGPNAKAMFVGYRIPTQAQSSIHPLRCVDVLPVIQHNIILPKEFTKITGSDKLSMFEPV